MMRRLLATLLAALLALGGAAALAEDWTCPACGTQNTGNFCVECGAVKPAEDWTCPACGTQNTGNFCTECGGAKPAEGWTCPACGTQNTGNFCTECGGAKPVEDWTCPACGTQNTGNFCVECGATKPAAPIEESGYDALLDAVWVVSAGNLTPGFIRMATVKKLIDSGDAQGFRALADKCLPVGDVRLSPDGRYAAVLTGTAQAPFVLIVRLEDMEALVAEGIDLGAGNVMTEGETGGVWWSESGLLVKGQKGITLWAIEG